MTNLISLISSPFQLICLGEYIKGRNYSNYKIYILYYSSYELKQIFDVSRFYNLKISGNIYGTRILQYFKIKKLGKKLKECEELVVGNLFSDPHLFFISLINYNKLTIVDDGIIVNKIPNYFKFNKRLLKESIYKRLIKKPLKIKYPIKFKLFTIFKIKPSKNLLVEMNGFKYLNSKMSHFRKSNLLIIIGQPLIEKNLLTKGEYFSIIRKITSENTSREIFYCPHRKEKKKNINEIVALNGVDLFQTETSIEIHLIKAKILPIKIVGFTSTALITIDKIFNQKKDNVVIESLRLNINSKLFLSLYNDIKNHNISIR